MTSLQKNKVYLFIRGLLVIAGGFLVHLTLGTMFTFGNMAPYIVSYARNQSHPAGLTQGTASWVFAFIFTGIGSTMTLGGWMVKKMGPRWPTLIGGWVVSLGTALTYFTIQLSFWLVVFTYGLLFGVGIGIAYTGPLSSAMKWLPKRGGFANGIVVSGLGLGPLVFNFVQTTYVNPDNVPTEADEKGEDYFTDLELLRRTPYVFLLLGGTYAIITLIGSLLLTDPPDGYNHEAQGAGITAAESEFYYEVADNSDDIPKKHNNGHASFENGQVDVALIDNGDVPSPKVKPAIVSLGPLQMLKKPGFYMLWLAFMFNGLTAVFVVTLYKFFGLEVGASDYYLAMVGSVSAIFNCLGRIIWGTVADKASCKVSMVLFSAIMTLFLLTIHVCTLGGTELFFIWVCVLFFCIGGNYSVLPAALARAYGIYYASVNYGLLFTSQIIAGCAGALLATVLDEIMGYDWLFFIISGFSSMGFLVSLLYKPKRYINSS
jgi:MFS family permease